MTEPTPIIVPLINPNEPGARLVALFVSPGQHVERGDKLCTLETTKSTVELSAETSGYVVGLTFMVGQGVQAGEILAYLSASPDWTPPIQPVRTGEQKSSHIPHLRISQPALLLAQQHNLDLSDLGDNVFIT